MKKNYFKKASIALSFAALLGSANVNAQILVSSTGNPGPTAYTSFGAGSTSNGVFAAINAGLQSGVITVSVVANVTEPASPVGLLTSGGTSNYTSISIKPFGGNFTINSATAPTASLGVLNLNGADNVTIDGDDAATAGTQNLSIIAAPVTVIGVSCIRLASNSITGADGANNNTIKNCILKGSRDAATSNVINYAIQFTDLSAPSNTLGAYSSTNTVIQGNTITRAYYGIHAIGSSSVYPNTGTSIASNTIGSATASDYVSFRGVDISYSGTNAVPSTAVITANDIRAGQASPTAPVAAVEIADGNAGIIIGRNNIHDGLNGAAVTISGMYGIAVTSPNNNSNILIRNNMIRDMKGGSVTTLGNVNGGIGVMVTASVTGLMMKHNTIAQMATGIIGSCVQINDANATVSQFLNNILTNTVSSAFNTCFYTAGTVNISGGTVDNNNYTIPAAGFLGYYNGATRQTLALWNTATGKDASSYSILPAFISATDLHITGGQLTVLESGGASTAVTSVTIDIDNQVRPGPAGSIYGGASAPDIGADEFDGIKSCSQTTISVTSSSPSGTVCSAGSVTLTGNSSSGSTTYTFNTVNNGTMSSTAAPSIVINPTVATTYTVVGTTFGCSSATIVNIAIDQTATVTAVSSATAICLNNSVSITASGARTYTLSNGVANGAAFSPTQTATYTVSGSNACGTVNTQITITVNPLPTLTVSAANPTLCSGSTTTLSVTGNAPTYTWIVAGSPTTAVLTVTPPAAGSGSIGTSSYTIIGTSALGCTNSAIGTVTVVTTPVIAPLASPSLVCSGGTTTLQTSGANTYSWLPGGQTSSLITVTPATVSVITPLTFTVIKANGSCSTTLTVGIEVHPLPNLFAVVNPTAVCAGSQATLTAGGALNYTWAPVVGTATGAVIIVTPNTSTNYTYTGNDGTCTAVATLSLPVNPIPTLVATASPTTICSGQPAVLTATGALSYTWSTFSSTSTATGSMVTFNPTLTTTYNVTGINSFGCFGTTSQVVFVNPLPNLNVTPASTLICLGKSATLTASTLGGTSTYMWDANAGNATTASVSVSPTITTVYTFTGTGTNGCPTTKTVTVNVFNQSFTVPTNTAVCFGSTITLGSTGAFTYTWLPGNAHTPSITVNPTVNTTYSVSGTSTVQNNSSVLSCRADYVFSVAVNPNPTVTAVASSSVICRGETTSLTATSLGGATSFTWLPAPASGTGSLVVVNSNDDPAHYVNTVTYTVTGANANHCRNTTTVQVITSGCVGIQSNIAANRELLIFPNPSNGEFTVKSDDAITLTLVNQMGQAIRTITLSDENGHKATVSDVATGIYFMVGANENGRVSQKVIISK